VIRVVVAIRAGKLHHAEFHAGILAHAGEAHGVWVKFTAFDTNDNEEGTNHLNSLSIIPSLRSLS
jgi:hypothetical protein